MIGCWHRPDQKEVSSPPIRLGFPARKLPVPGKEPGQGSRFAVWDDVTFKISTFLRTRSRRGRTALPCSVPAPVPGSHGIVVSPTYKCRGAAHGRWWSTRLTTRLRRAFSMKAALQEIQTMKCAETNARVGIVFVCHLLTRSVSGLRNSCAAGNTYGRASSQFCGDILHLSLEESSFDASSGPSSRLSNRVVLCE